MTETNNIAGEDEITLKEVIANIKSWLRYLFSNWIWIILAIFLGGISGFYYGHKKKVLYTARCTFVMEGGSATTASASGLASVLGIDVGGSSGLFQAQNILPLYKSRLMIEKTLFSKADYSNKGELLIDKYVQFTVIGNNWASIPKLHKNQTLKSIIIDIDQNHLKVKSEELIAVTVEAENELFAKAFAETIVEKVNSFYIDTKTKKSLEALAILQRQADSIKRVMNFSMTGAASASDANPNANAALQVLRVPAQRRQIDVQTSSAIYTEVVRNIETTRMALRRETPLIQIVDRPFLPLDKEEPNSFKFALIGGFLAPFIAIILLTLTKLYKKIMSS